MPLLTNIRQYLVAQLQITAAWLAGSRGRGTADGLSDIDIWVAVVDDAIGAINADPLAFVHAIAPTLMHVRASYIDPPGGAFMLTWIPVGEGFEQVDWYWTPASTAARPSRTKLLFERRPIPVVDPPEPGRVDDNALAREIDGAIKDSLLLIAYAWKQVRRGNPWRTVAHIQHANDCLAKLDWLIAHGRAPEFYDAIRSFLPEAVPVGKEDTRAALQCLLGDLSALIDDAGCERQFQDAIAALSATLSV